jgi:hypothetical protein
MLNVLHDQRRWMIVLTVIALLVAAFSIGRTASAETPWVEGGDLLYNEGIVCFGEGQQSSTIAIGGPVGYDVTFRTLGFATLQGFGGSGVFVRNVVVSGGTDRVKVVLTKPATRDVCAAWHVIEQEYLG